MCGETKLLRAYGRKAKKTAVVAGDGRGSTVVTLCFVRILGSGYFGYRIPWIEVGSGREW